MNSNLVQTPAGLSQKFKFRIISIKSRDRGGWIKRKKKEGTVRGYRPTRRSFNIPPRL